MPGLKFDEFLDKLNEYKAEFQRVRNKELESIRELEEFLIQRKLGRFRSRSLKSLKGFDI